MCFFCRHAYDGEHAIFFLFRYHCLSFFDYRTYTTRAIVTCCVFCLIFNNYGTRSRGTGRRLGNNSSFSRGDVMCAGELSRLPLFLLPILHRLLFSFLSLSLFSLLSSFYVYHSFSRCFTFNEKATLGARQDAPVKSLSPRNPSATTIVKDLDVVLCCLCLFMYCCCC